MDESLRFANKVGISENIVSDIRSKTRIIITTDDICAKDYNCQVILEVATNLLSRIFPHILVEVPHVEADYLKTISFLPEHLNSVIKDGYTWDEFQSNPTKDVYFVVGSRKVNGDAIYVDADGWISYIGTLPNALLSKSSIKLPFGAIAAACIGVSELFKHIFREFIKKEVHLINGNIRFNTLSYNNSNINLDISRVILDRTVLFGCGSVGSSLLYSLSFIPVVTGELDIVDRDKKVDFNNLQRYSYLTVSDITAYKGITKAKWATNKTLSKLPELKITPWDNENGTITAYLNSRPSQPGIKLAISAVDNVEARIEIADCLAQRTINAGTGDTTLTITRHGFADGKACLACEYISKIPNVSWYHEVSRITNIPPERVAQLLQGHFLLSPDDINRMVSAGFISQDNANEFIGADFQSIVNRRLYAAVNVANNNNEARPVTAPFVAAMSGSLLAGEMIKETCGLQNCWDNNKYRTDMLSLPTMYTTLAVKEQRHCLCSNHFRKQKYLELWLVTA